MLVGMGLGVALVAAFVVWMASHPAPPPAPAGVPDTIALAPAPRPAALTREDSLAIAAAIERKFAEQRAATRAQRESAQAIAAPAPPAPAPAASVTNEQLVRLADSLRAAIQKSVLDSVTRVRGRRPDIEALVGAAVSAESARRLMAPFEFTVQPGDRPPRRRDDLSPAAFADRAANMGPPRRVFVSIPRVSARASGLALVADSLADSLRRAIARNPRYEVIDADSTRQMLARTRTVSTISRLMEVELFTSLIVSVMPDSSVMWNMTVRDLSAVSAYSMRGMSVKGDPGAPLSAVDKLVAASIQFLADVDRAPRAPVGVR
jgi:hypothetical protein